MVKCPWCQGRVNDKGLLHHLQSCPAKPAKPPQTINEILEQLGSRFRVEEENI